MRDQLRQLIPKQYTYRLVDLKKRWLEGFSEPTFSEHGEDIILTKHIFKTATDGFYVDIGAFHPEYISNTKLLHQRGWQGINVDPNPEAIAIFKKQRPNDINLQLGIAGSERKATYYNFQNAGTNTFSVDQANEKLQRGQLINTKEIDCVPLSKLFSEHLPTGQTIDLLDIDVEDMDLEVLQSNDWNQYRPRVIIVEDRDFRVNPGDSQVYGYLQERGYSFYSYLGLSLIMCDPKTVRAVNKF